RYQCLSALWQGTTPCRADLRRLPHLRRQPISRGTLAVRRRRLCQDRPVPRRRVSEAGGLLTDRAEVWPKSLRNGPRCMGPRVHADSRVDRRRTAAVGSSGQAASIAGAEDWPLPHPRRVGAGAHWLARAQPVTRQPTPVTLRALAVLPGAQVLLQQ